MKDLLIFLQAPADLPYMLKLYEENVGKCRITISVQNVENVYKFVQMLNLNVDNIFFTPYITNAHVLHSIWFIKTKKYLRGVYKEHFACVKNTKVVFFSIVEDIYSCYFVKRLAKERSNCVIYAEHYDHNSLGSTEHYIHVPIKRRVLSVLYYLLMGLHIDTTYSNRIFCWTNWAKYGIKKLEAQEVDSLEKYLYKLPVAQGKKNILMLTNPWAFQNDLVCNDVRQQTLKIINTLQLRGYNVIVKGHPRMGLHSDISKIADATIPLYVPSEFLDVSKLQYIISDFTSGVRFFCDHYDVPVYSYLNVYHNVDINIQKMFTDYLRNLTHNKIIFINKIIELDSTNL